MRVLSQRAEYGHVDTHLAAVLVDAFVVPRDQLLVVFDLVADVFAGFGDDVTVVQTFDGGLERESDEEADGDGEVVEEEVAPAVDGLVRWVDVDQGGVSGAVSFLGCRANLA